MSPFHFTAPPRRQGVILLIVVILLALFAVMGLSFMLYAESQATASRIYREAQSVTNKNVADIEPKTLLNYGLSQLIYDGRDDGSDLYSAMRGHSLARNMYGWNYQFNGTWSPSASTLFNPVLNSNTTAFNGLGALWTNPAAFGRSDYELPNYLYHKNDNLLRDPERFGTRPDVNTNPALRPYAGGANVAYTFPDRNNMFLAAIQTTDPLTGAVTDRRGQPINPTMLQPSFVRPTGTFGSLNTKNPNWGLPGQPGKPELKYMVLRPRPGDHLGFPPPADNGGDVKNLPPGTNGYNGGQNDSYWIDLGYPVQITGNGKKFKPLFAFLITDLDNRLNVNVHGNVKGVLSNNQVHVSNQGLTAHEASLYKVLAADPGNVLALTEYQQLFLGAPLAAPAKAGRYGADKVPGSPAAPFNIYTDSALALGTMPSFLAPLDYDAVDQTTGGPTTRFQFPQNFSAFPTFKTGSGGSTGYDNLQGTPIDPRVNNPLLYNALRATTMFDSAPFTAGENMFYLLAAPGSLWNRSTLNNVLPSSLSSRPIRNLITTTSFDLETPGVTPFYNDVFQSPTSYSLKSGELFPTGGGVAIGAAVPATPSPAANALGSQPRSEFKTADGRAVVLSRLDLRRPLTPFGKPDGSPTGGPVFELALRERQQFARDIYLRLVLATGANDYPNINLVANPGLVAKKGTKHHDALRYLAQLAVNIVDYIDDDDIMTPFNDWGDPSSPEYVFGTELPKLVLNEAFAEIHNDPADTMPPAMKQFKVHFWIELLNPLTADAGVTDPTTGKDRAWVVVQSAVNPYRVLVVDQASVPPGQSLLDTQGNPTAAAVAAQVVSFKPSDKVPGPITDFVRPGTPGSATSPQGQNIGFYVLGPNNEDLEDAPGTLMPTNKQDGLSVAVPGTPAASVNQPTYDVVLQRLANPALAMNAVTNPYVTVDYMVGVKAQDAVNFTTNPIMANAKTLPGARFSTGRAQPYAAAIYGAPTAPAPGSQIKATFFAHNGSAPSPYDWLVHLDRAPISVAELLHVPGFKPHELTHQFMHASTPSIPGSLVPTAIADKFRHTAPFGIYPRSPGGPTQMGFTLNEVNNARLFRALEYFTVSDRTLNAFGGRKPGMININTVWDKITLDALADGKSKGANVSNFFTQMDVDTIWQNLLARRTGVLKGTGLINRPIWGAGAIQPTGGDPQYPNQAYLDGVGVQDTLYGGVFTTQLNAPQPSATNQSLYADAEPLTKMRNTLTTRSNVFAVWFTVGFFEVIDDTTLPVKLGPEVLNRDGTPTRHKFFSIVDRTNLAVDWTNALQQASDRPVVVTSLDGVASPGGATVRLAGGSLTGQYDGGNIVFPASTAGNRVVVDVGANQEIVNATVNPAAGTVTATFTKPHAPGFLISNVLLGNPGPQGTSFDLFDANKGFQYVVPTYKIIQ